MFGVPIFEGRNQILLLGKALKFKVIFQTKSLKWIKSWKIIEKIRENLFPKYDNVRAEIGETK